MRFLIALLIIANMLFLVGSQWIWDRPERIVYQLPEWPSPMPDDVKPIELLSEKVDATSVTQDVSAILEVDAAIEPDVDIVTESVVVDVVAEVFTPLPEDETPRLFVLSDEPADDSLACTLVGPIVETQGTPLLNRIRTAAITARADDVLKIQVAGYSVILGPYVNSEEALTIHHALEEEQLDNFVFSDEEQRNGISLGYFGTRDAAERLVASVRELGLKPAIREREQMSREHWISVTGISAEQWTDLVTDEFPEARFWEGYCSVYLGLAP